MPHIYHNYGAGLRFRSPRRLFLRDEGEPTMVGRRTRAIGMLIAVITSRCALGYMRVKEESHGFGPPGIANWWNVHVFYARESARRDDVWSALDTHSAVIRHCDTGKGYYVDFEHK